LAAAVMCMVIRDGWMKRLFYLIGCNRQVRGSAHCRYSVNMFAAQTK
ncbi:MAG: hypothetical protein JWP34_782, partial [Massilia sp.]|nr:hypothetical protein [Massilia sp.]